MARQALYTLPWDSPLQSQVTTSEFCVARLCHAPPPPPLKQMSQRSSLPHPLNHLGALK